jgi:hypothetical protein
MQSRRRSKSDVCEMRIVSNADWLSPEPVVPIKKMNSELLPITEPEVSFGKLGFRFVAQDFLRGDLPRVLRTRAADWANIDSCNSDGNRDSNDQLRAAAWHDRLHP